MSTRGSRHSPLAKRLVRRAASTVDAWLSHARRAQYAFALGSVGDGAWFASSARIRGFTDNVSVGAMAWLGEHVTLDCNTPEASIRIGDRTSILPYAMLLTHGGTISVGNDSSVNPFCVLYGHGGLEIGNKVRIATHVVMIPANHLFGSLEHAITEQGLSTRGIVIEDDVWIGAGATILDGVHIRRGSVVAAGAVVREDLGPYEIAAGVPARVVKRRS